MSEEKGDRGAAKVKVGDGTILNFGFAAVARRDLLRLDTVILVRVVSTEVYEGFNWFAEVQDLPAR